MANCWKSAIAIARKNVRFSVFQSENRPVPKNVYCYRYCFLEAKQLIYNEVGTCAELLPVDVVN